MLTVDEKRRVETIQALARDGYAAHVKHADLASTFRG